jgi:hypothetical protein
MRNEMWKLDAYNPLLYRAPKAHGREARLTGPPATA